MAGSVFHDPSGRRGRRAGLALGLVLATIAAIGAGFAVTLALAPKLPNLQLKDPNVRRIIDEGKVADLNVNPIFAMKDLRAVPDEWRKGIPEYIKDYVPLNTFMP